MEQYKPSIFKDHNLVGQFQHGKNLYTCVIDDFSVVVRLMETSDTTAEPETETEDRWVYGTYTHVGFSSHKLQNKYGGEKPFAFLLPKNINSQIPIFRTGVVVKARINKINRHFGVANEENRKKWKETPETQLDLRRFNDIEFCSGSINVVFNPTQAVWHAPLEYVRVVENIEDVTVEKFREWTESNPKAWEDMLKKNTTMRDTAIVFQPYENWCIDGEVKISDNQKIKVSFNIWQKTHGYSYNSDHVGEDGAINLGSVDALFRFHFDSPQQLDEIRKYQYVCNLFLSFLCNRQNVDFKTRLLHKEYNNNYTRTADCYFSKSNQVDLYNGDEQNTIQISDLGDKWNRLLQLFVSDTEFYGVFLRFLPENNKDSKRIAINNVIDICTSFEMAWNWHKTNTSLIMSQISQYEDEDENGNKYGKNKSFRRIWYLCHYVAGVLQNDTITKKSVYNFVKCRHRIVHDGIIEWNNVNLFAPTLTQCLCVLILIRAGYEQNEAIRISKKWLA